MDDNRAAGLDERAHSEHVISLVQCSSAVDTMAPHSRTAREGIATLVRVLAERVNRPPGDRIGKTDEGGPAPPARERFGGRQRTIRWVLTGVTPRRPYTGRAAPVVAGVHHQGDSPARLGRRERSRAGFANLAPARRADREAPHPRDGRPLLRLASRHCEARETTAQPPESRGRRRSSRQVFSADDDQD